MAGDADYNKVALLLHFDGADGATTFVDSSSKAATLTRIGSAKISTAKSKYGGASGLLAAATSDAVLTSLSTNYGIGSGDFTIEGWLNQGTQGAADRCLFDNRTGSNQGFAIYSSINAAGQNDKLSFATNSTVAATSSMAWTPNTWQHWAICRQGTTVNGFIDGALAFTLTDSRTYAASAQCFIGANYLSGQFFNGNLDDVRLTIGLARYTAAFTPPTAPFPDGMGQVSGVVTDSSGAPAARPVRAYRRDTGALVTSTTSDGTTGAYSFYVPTLDEVTVLAIDDATSDPLYNDSCVRVIPAP